MLQLPPLSRTLASGLCLGLLATAGYSRAESRPSAPDTGTNVLIVGNDSRAGMSNAQKWAWNAGGTGCNCADVIMIAHLSADGSRASVVSLPRDSYVQFAPHQDGGYATSHHGKINAARQHGGPRLLVRTVQRATGLKIHHYLETRLSGFVKAVGDLGGATVCTKEPMHDTYSGISLAPGTHHLDGAKSLKYVRTRHSGFGDIDRVRRQQRLVADIAGRHLRDGTLADDAGLRALTRKVITSLRPHGATGFTDLVQLGFKARNLQMENVEFATVPLSDIGYTVPVWGSTVAWNEAQAKRLFAAMRDDRRLAPVDRRGPQGGFDWQGRVTPGSRMVCR